MKIGLFPYVLSGLLLTSTGQLASQPLQPVTELSPQPTLIGPDGKPAYAAGTRAPDGMGVSMDMTPGVGEMEDGVWVDGTVGTPLKAGDRMPAGSMVQDIDGNPFDLNTAVASQPTILIFYRGGWCPYCNAHLRELQSSVPALEEMGYQILAISTDTPEALKVTAEEQQMSYQLLSDVKVSVADGFGLKFRVKDNYLDHVKNDRGTDLVAQNGGNLLTPGAFVMSTDGVIRFAYVNQNFTVRVSQEVLLKAARDAL